MAAKKKTETVELDVLKLQQGRMVAYIRGVTALIYNAMSAKTRQGLLSPKKKTAVEKQSSLKHDPPAEFRGTLYTWEQPATLLCFKTVAFKNALASSALDIGGAKRTQVARLVWVRNEFVPIWGVPMLRMDVVRSADMNRTPDIRTRACLAEWATKIELEYVQPVINDTMVANMLAAAGLIRGIGDFRQEKGAGNFGQFQIVDQDDEDWARIVKEGARAQQEAAVENPTCYNEESEALLTWWHEEAARRGHKPANGHAGVTQ